MEVLKKIIRDQFENDHGGLVIIESPVGQGKTRLVSEAKSLAYQFSTTCLSGMANSTEKSVAYFPFKGMIDQIVRRALNQSNAFF
jgi:hypothetical protein